MSSSGGLNVDALVEAAKKARLLAYVPYSQFPVGAALLGKSGRVYTGCNIENSAYSATNCAERTAIFKAVSEGERDFAALAVVADTEGTCPPCGMCRQVISEFSRDLPIILANLKGVKQITSIDRLLPGAFGPEYLLHGEDRIERKREAGEG